MIEINLLPLEHRPIDRTPAPRLATLLIGTLLASLLVVVSGYFWYVRKPQLANEYRNLKTQQKQFQDDALEVDQIDGKIREYRARQGTVVTLIDQRVSWTRLLDSLADKCTEDPKVWLTELDYTAAMQIGFMVGGGEKGDTIKLIGYGLGEDGTQMFAHANRFIGQVRAYESFAQMFVPGGIFFRDFEIKTGLRPTGGTAKVPDDAPDEAGEFHVDAELYPPGKRPKATPTPTPAPPAPTPPTGVTPAPAPPAAAATPAAETTPGTGGGAPAPAPEDTE